MTATPSIPLSYYVIVPSGGFSQIEAILGNKTQHFSIPQRRAVRDYLLEYGDWTDDNQFEHDKSRDFKYWVIDGRPRVIVEAVA